MLRSFWRLFLAAALLAGLATACGRRPARPQASPVEIYAPSLQPDALAGVQAAGPFPEYRLALALDPATGRLAGRQQVWFPNRTGVELEEIVFRLYPNLPQYGGRLSVGAVWVDGERGRTSARAGNTALAVSLPSPLAPRSSTIISLTFELEIPAKDGGYVLFGHSQGVWSVPDGYPLLAVHDDSGWHEDIPPAHGDAVVAETGLYDVSLMLPADLILAATGTVVAEAQPGAPEGPRVYQIAGTPLREFAWFAGAGYQVAETTAYNTVLRSYYLPGDEAAGQAVLSVAAAALRAYGDAFGPYPYAEMKVVESPLSYYGMEYPGLNLIGLDLYRDRRDQLEIRVAHEIAHQWWYGQVGSDQVNRPWLDEGLAEHSTAIYIQQVYGAAEANTLINQRWLVPYQVLVDSGADAVVNQPAAAFGLEYEVIVYAKAALFFNAVRQRLGDEGYLQVLREYANRYRWGMATPDGFLAMAEDVSGQDLDDLYSRWILGTEG